MSRFLVTYATNSGSTAEVAEAVAAELNRDGHTAAVQPVNTVSELSCYDAVIIGAPMIFGWHTGARRFLRKHRDQLSQKKTAFFGCAMRLTQADGEENYHVDLVLDPGLVSTPEKPGSLSLKERFTSLGHYLKPMLIYHDIKPCSAAFFHGKLDMRLLKWWQALFVMIVVQAVPGDYRDWDAVRAWGKKLRETM